MSPLDAQADGLEPIGFIGLGVMGLPIALNLVNAGTKLIVWNRSSESTERLRIAGAQVAQTIDEVFEKTKTLIVMLLDSTVIDQVLGRHTPAFAPRVSGHTLISMSSVAPDYSRGLASDIYAEEGSYLEAPVSGSRKPAEAGQLVVLLGGHTEVIRRIRPLLAPICRASVICGQVGDALLIKLSINLYLNTMLAGLAEAMHFAASQGLNLSIFQSAIDSGPMACDVTRIKIPKLIEQDFSVQAATLDIYANCQLITSAARATHVATPLLDLSLLLYGESVALGNGRLDVVSVIKSVANRSAALP